eukprot:gene7350-11672_t
MVEISRGSNSQYCDCNQLFKRPFYQKYFPNALAQARHQCHQIC